MYGHDYHVYSVSSPPPAYTQRPYYASPPASHPLARPMRSSHVADAQTGEKLYKDLYEQRVSRQVFQEFGRNVPREFLGIPKSKPSQLRDRGPSSNCLYYGHPPEASHLLSRDLIDMLFQHNTDKHATRTGPNMQNPPVDSQLQGTKTKRDQSEFVLYLPKTPLGFSWELTTCGHHFTVSKITNPDLVKGGLKVGYIMKKLNSTTIQPTDDINRILEFASGPFKFTFDVDGEMESNAASSEASSSPEADSGSERARGSSSESQTRASTPSEPRGTPLQAVDEETLLRTLTRLSMKYQSLQGVPEANFERNQIRKALIQLKSELESRETEI